jgi:hypothetical protein
LCVVAGGEVGGEGLLRGRGRLSLLGE